MFPIIWLTGNTDAGKTTLAFGAENHFNEQVPLHLPYARRVVVLDGDEMRATISTEETLSPSDRRRHNLRVARLAKLLQKHGFLVIVAVIAPFERVRHEIDILCSPLWVYVKRSLPEHPDRPYEPPPSPHWIIDHDCHGIPAARTLFCTFIANCMQKKSVALPTTSPCSAH